MGKIMIRLSRTIPINCFDVEATVAVGRQRPEFLAVAQLAADLKRPISSRDVLRELLGPRPEVLGRRVIERCIALGLLHSTDSRNSEAELSEAGALALEYGEVLVPEEGVWRFYLVDDPLVPNKLLHAERLESDSVKKERDAAKNARNRGDRPIRSAPAPEILRGCCGDLPSKSAYEGHLLQLIELAQSGTSGPKGALRLGLTWDRSSEAMVELSGPLPSDSRLRNPRSVDVNIELPEIFDDLEYQTVWSNLASLSSDTPLGELDEWFSTAGEPVIPLTFDSMSEDECKGFRRNVAVPASEWEQLGAFDSTVLENIRIVPATEADAQTWLKWLQWNAINDYVTPHQIEEMGAELLTCFPYHKPRPLSPSALLAQALTTRNERSFFLLAPSDLGLWS